MVKRIMYVIPSLYDSGVTKVLSNIIKGLDLKKFKPIVITISHKPLGRYANQIIKKHVKIISLTNKKTFLSFRQIKRFREIISKFQPQIIHYHSFKADCYRVFQPNDIYSISTAHNIAKDDFTMRYGFLIGKIMEKIELHLFKKMTHVISVSHSVRNYLKSNGISNSTIYNGTDNQMSISKCKSNNKIVKNNKFLVLGEVSELKNVSEILKTFNNNNISGEVYVVGDGDQRKPLEKEFSNNNRIHFEGYSTKVPLWLQHTNVMISASKSEGLPMGVIEAMSYGMNIILSDIPSHRELDPDKKSIIYFDSNKELFRAMNKKYLYRNSNVLSIQHKIFDSQLMALKYEQYYLRLLRK